MGELDEILQCLQLSLGSVDGDPAPLEGGITNRNFKVRIAACDYVVRLHGKDTELLGISREAELRSNEAAAELGIAPRVVASFRHGLVTHHIDCEPLGQRELHARAEELARALRRFHDSGVRLPIRFWVPTLLDVYAGVVSARGGELPAGYARAREVACEVGAALSAHEARPCHNDLLAGNLLRERGTERIVIVDWEYAGMGHAYFDLGNLSVNNDFDEDLDERLLRAYEGATPTPSQRATLRLMRLLSDAREGAWGVMQDCVSDLDFDFAEYARRHLQRLAAAAEQADYERWLSAAAA